MSTIKEKFNKSEILSQGLASVIFEQLNSSIGERGNICIFSPNFEDSCAVAGMTVGYLESMGMVIDDPDVFFENVVWDFEGFEVHFEILEHEVNMMCGLGNDRFVEEDDHILVWVDGDATEIV